MKYLLKKRDIKITIGIAAINPIKPWRST